MSRSLAVALGLLAGCDAVLHLQEVGSARRPPGGISVSPFITDNVAAKNTMMFSAHAHAAGDAIALQLGCHTVVGNNTANGVTIAALGWTWMTLEDVTIGGSIAAASFGAIAPDASVVSIVVTWTGTGNGPCTESASAIGDDFTTEGIYELAFNRHSVATNTGNCSGTVRTGGDEATVWAACNAAGNVTGVGSGYTKGTDDGHGNWTEYRLTADPAETDETATLSANGSHTVIDLATIVEP